ncbi:CCA tRNA nucleotidyltransferase [Candidatus Magnetominusculus xianensis]|uniref:tRNA nucleotidyltransferase/poly(A) polymerase n=1 Tax=Candidatus Magnetominusculus xianensis TaxID=1748249 RepID=A0ABR5SJK6_9BACT|nr:HD domain-containing protein [Candidatus Magnetominusculus xianensis]KWT92661.1 tRNA nucleotidyltransferase/poly(A) polymerase [Candidatus Magnetominusculus xianensis]MBF0403788.1 CCA tRNA nucleotidyltransferase [Nitrospirota bacterium]
MIENIPYIGILRELTGSCREVFLVGGTLRDSILNRQVRDYDIALSESPFTVARWFADAINGAYVMLHERFPTARVVKGDCVYDFTALRGGSIESDLLSRDFTVNALAVSINNPVDGIIDVTGGLGDINNRIIRMVSKDNLAEDPVRLLRAFRVAAELGFTTIDTDTLAAIADLKGGISVAAVERVWAEFKMLLQADNSAEIIKSACETGLLFELLPELEPLRGLRQNRWHHLDVFDHTMAAYEAAESVTPALPFHENLRAWFEMYPHKSALIKLAILLHDVGKYRTYGQSKDGHITFYRHEQEGTAIAADIMTRFKASTKETEFVTMLVKNHLRILAFKRVGGAGLSTMKRPLIRLLNTVGDAIYALVVVWIADSAAKLEGTDETIGICSGILDFYENKYLPRKTAPRFITGRDLIETFKLTPSPLFSEILGAIELQTLEGQIDSKAKAAALVDEFLHARGGG